MGMTEKPTGERPFHIEVLRQELLQRQARNSRYSLRRFADFLELHPSALSRILAGKHGLTIRSARIVLSKLTLSEEEQTRFIASIACEKAEDVFKVLGASSLPVLGFSALRAQLRSTIESVAESSAAGNDGLYVDLVEFLPQPSCLVSREGNVSLCNAHWSAAMGFDSAKPVQLTSLLHPEDQADFIGQWERAQLVGQPFQLQCRLRVLSGGYQSYELRTMPLKDEAGRVARWMSVSYERAESQELKVSSDR